MKQEIKDYSKQISDLRKEILESIRELLIKSGMDCVELVDYPDTNGPTIVDPVMAMLIDKFNPKYACEVEARALIYERGKISLELYDNNEDELITVQEYDYALRDIDTLNNLYVALQTKLNENGTDK